MAMAGRSPPLPHSPRRALGGHRSCWIGDRPPNQEEALGGILSSSRLDPSDPGESRSTGRDRAWRVRKHRDGEASEKNALRRMSRHGETDSHRRKDYTECRRGRAVGLDPSLAPRFVLRLSIGTRKDATGPSSSITRVGLVLRMPPGNGIPTLRSAISPRSGAPSPRSASRDRKRLEARACLAPGERSVPLGAECDRVEIAEGSSRSAGKTHPTGTPLAGGAGRRRSDCFPDRGLRTGGPRDHPLPEARRRLATAPRLRPERSPPGLRSPVPSAHSSVVLPDGE